MAFILDVMLGGLMALAGYFLGVQQAGDIFERARDRKQP